MRKARNPWERMPRESDPAWEAFVMYRDMPEETGLKRSITRLEQRLHKSRALLGGWSSKYHWVERASAYDSYMDDQKIEERRKQKKKQAEQEQQMDDRQIDMSVQLQRFILDYMQATDVSDLTPKGLADLSNAAKNATSLERQGRHTTQADKQLELSREKFEYEKERDAGLNAEYEDLDETEADIYGTDDEDA